MKTKYQTQSHMPGKLFAGGLLAILCLALAAVPARAATTNFLNVASVSSGGSYGLDNAYWNTTSETATPLADYTASDSMCIGANPGDFNGYSISIPFNYSASTHLTGSGGGTITIGSTNVVVTFNGADNDYFDVATAISVAQGSTLIEDVDWNALGLNFDNQTVTLTGGGTITFQTPIGLNSSGPITMNMPGGTNNLVVGKTATDPFTGGFTLTAGTLNFTTTASGNAFNGFSTKSFSINGGSIDNTSGSYLLLGLGASTNSIGGNFTFVGSSSLDFGTAPVTNTANHTITVGANTLYIGGVISGAGNGLTMNGNGTLSLYGVNTYSGNTLVTAGTLALTNNGSIASSAQVGISGAAFDVTGLARGSTSLTTYCPTNSSLNVALLSTSVTNVLVGTLNIGGTSNTINITSLPEVTSYPQTYSIVKGTTVNGTLNFVLGMLPNSISTPFGGYITNVAATGSANFVLTNGPTPVLALSWNGLNGGTPSSTWDVGTTPTWLNGATPSVFDQLDIVTFNDTAGGSTVVNLSGGLQPGSLVVSNNVLSYTFTGNQLQDPYPATLTLAKQGAGALLLQESGDNFSGGFNVQGGTLIVDNDSSGINGGITIGAGATVQMGTNDTATVNLPQGTATVNGALVFNSQDNYSVANPITGNGTVSQMDTNVVMLTGTSSGNWAANIQNGTLQAQNSAALGNIPGGIVTVTNGGTFDLGGDTLANTANFGNKQFNVSGTGVGGNGAIINSAYSDQEDAFQNILLTANTTVSGPTRWDMRNGTPELNLNGYTLTVTNINYLALVAVTVTPGNIIIQQGGTLSFQLGCSVTGAGTITVESGGDLGLYESTLGGVTRSVVLNGGGVIDQSANNEVAYLDSPILMDTSSVLQNSANNVITYYDGVISDGGNGLSLTFTGGGTNILSATNTYSGDTIIAQGTLALNGYGSISGSPLIAATNSATFNVSTLVGPFSGTNSLVLGDDVNGIGTLTLGNNTVTNFNYISLSNAFVNMSVVNPKVPCITVTNLNLGDGGAAAYINVTALPVLPPTQFPLIKYRTLSGIYNLYLGTMPGGYSGTLVNNTANNSIDLQITQLPSGIWNGGDSATDNDWSDPVNWNGTGLTGYDGLNFTGTAGLNNTNDVSFTENADFITFLSGAGAFILNGNPVTLLGGVTNNSAYLQTVDLGLSFGSSGTNLTLNGGSAGLIIGNGLTNTFGAPGYTTLTLAGTGILTNLLNSTTSPGGTNVLLFGDTNGNWTLANNASSAAMTVPWNFQINAGTFNFGVGSSAPILTNSSAQGLPQDNQVGATAGAMVTLNMSNGVWTTIARLNTALANDCTGIVSQVGGTLNIGSQFQGGNAGDTNAQSIVTISGGTMNINGGTGTFYNASRDQGMLTLTNTGTLNCGILDVSRNANGATRGSVGVVNLNGGTIVCGRVGTAVANGATNAVPTSLVYPTANFNFNGGTLTATGSATNFFQGSTSLPTIPITTIVRSGGAIVNDGGFAITMWEPLQHDSTLGATADGGFIKNGAGTNTLNGANTYTGNTVISNGTLVVVGSLAAASAVNVTANGALSGTGTVGGPVTVNGTITPGIPGTNGVLTCSANVTINGAALMKLNNLANDSLVVGGTLTYGSILNVPILAGTPALNNSFKLFTAANYSGNFAVTNLPVLGGGLAWNWNPANGTLSVVSGVNLNPTNILATVSGNTLSLAWPADHTGWTLQCQTNSLGSGLNPNAPWFALPGSTAVDSVNITLDPSQPTVFYRLQHP